MNLKELKSRINHYIDNPDKYVILDTETTGLGNDAEIVELGILSVTGEILYDGLIKPTKRIPQDAIAIHGIKNEDVKNSPSWFDVFEDVNKILEGKTILAYNSKFDIRMIYQTNKLFNLFIKDLDHECVYELMTEYNGYSSKLESFSETVQSHRAVDDCMIIYKDIFKKHLVMDEDAEGYCKYDEPIEDIIEGFLNEEDKLEIFREWSLITSKAKEIKKDKWLYKNISDNTSEEVSIIGHVDKQVVVISFEDGNNKMILPAFLKQMQSKNFSMSE